MKNKFEMLTKKDYTPNDIFIKNNRLFFIIPALIFATTPIVEFILCSAYFNEHPFSFNFTYPATVYSAVFFGLIFSLTAFICFFIKNKKSLKEIHNLRLPEIWLFVAFSFVAILTTLLGSFRINRANAFENIYYILAEFLIYFLCSAFVSEEKLKKIVIYYILSVSIILALTEFADQLGFAVPIYRIDTHVTAVFYSPNYYGYFLTICLMLCASLFTLASDRGEKIFLAVSFVINSVAFAMANCYGTFLACIAGFAVMIFVTSVLKKKFDFIPLAFFALFMFICFIVGLKYPSFFSDIKVMAGDIENIVEKSENASSAGTGRWGIWMATLDLIKQKPLFGWGAGGIEQELFDRVGINRAHNEYFAFAADYGIPAMLIYISGLICIFIRAWLSRRKIDGVSAACLIASFAYMFSALFGNNKYYVAPFFFIVLGFCVSYGIPKSSPEEKA